MPKKQTELESFPKLRMPLKSAQEILEQHIREGEQLLKISIRDMPALHSTEKKYNNWNGENFNILKQIFDTITIAKEYSLCSWTVGRILISDLTLDVKIEKLQNNIQEKIDKLKSIKASLEILDTDIESFNNKVYFIHAKDDKITTSVLKFLKQKGIKPIIIKELSLAGKSILEEISSHPDIKYAIAVLTPKSKKSLSPDQNIILEMGLFIGRLGRKNVSGLCTENIKLPADYREFSYIKIDDKNSWQQKLIQEMKESGIEIK